MSARSTCGSSTRWCRCRNSRARRRGRRGLRWNNVRWTAPGTPSGRTASGSRIRFWTSGTGSSVASSWTDLVVRRGFPRAPSRSDERRMSNGRRNRRTREATTFGEVTRVSARPLRGVRMEVVRPIAATILRRTFPGRAASPARAAPGAMTSRRGARAALPARSQRAVDLRAMVITRAVTTTNARAISVSEATDGPPPVRPRKVPGLGRPKQHADDPANGTALQGVTFRRTQPL